MLISTHLIYLPRLVYISHALASFLSSHIQLRLLSVSPPHFYLIMEFCFTSFMLNIIWQQYKGREPYLSSALLLWQLPIMNVYLIFVCRTGSIQFIKYFIRAAIRELRDFIVMFCFCMITDEYAICTQSTQVSAEEKKSAASI